MKASLVRSPRIKVGTPVAVALGQMAPKGRGGGGGGGWETTVEESKNEVAGRGAR